MKHVGMLVKRVLFVFAAGFSVGLFAAERPVAFGCRTELSNPALPPVDCLAAPVHQSVSLLRDARPAFCIVGDFRREAAVSGPDRDGKPIPIAFAGRDSRIRAARLLQEAFRRTCGASPEILEADDPRSADFPAVIVCGTCRYTRALAVDADAFRREEFEVRTFGPGAVPWAASQTGVVLAGMDGFEIPGTFDAFEWRSRRLACNGTELAATDFVERFLGVRKYADPDRAENLTWEHYPACTNLTLAPVAYRDRPRQRLRWLRTPWRAGVSSGFFGGESPFPSTLVKAHPDRLDDMFYRDPEGRLWCDAKSYGMNFLDVTNLKLADILVDDFRLHYAGKGYYGETWAPNGNYLWFGQCDKAMPLENETVRALRAANPALTTSDVYARFYRYFARRCAESLPAKTVVLMAYLNYLEPPRTTEPLPENVQILCCVGSPVFVRHPGYVARWRACYEGWNRLTRHLCVPYTYDAGYQPDEAIVQALRGYFEGEFYRAVAGCTDPELSYNCMYEMGGKYHYSTYLATRAMWNPLCDADAEIREYFRLMYGAAAPFLTEFYYGLVERWTKHYLPGAPVGRGSIPAPNLKDYYSRTFPGETCRALVSLLDRAAASVPPASMEARRCAWFSRPFRNVLEDIVAYQNIRYPHLDVPGAAAAPVIDGRLDESVWSRSRVPEFHRAFAGGTQSVISPETHVLWDDAGIYVAIRSPAPVVGGNALWNGDVFEVLLAPGEEKNANLYQFLLDPEGRHEDYWMSIDPPRAKDINWRAEGFRCAACRTEDGGWTGELFVPWSDVSKGVRPKVGETWRLNFVYNRVTPKEYVSLSPTLNNNHRTEMYAYLHFVK